MLLYLITIAKDVWIWYSSLVKSISLLTTIYKQMSNNRKITVAEFKVYISIQDGDFS